MDASSRNDATSLLGRANEGDKDALAELVVLLQRELRECAARHLRRQNRNHTLQATDLMDELSVRLLNSEGAAWNDRAHFLAAASRAMQNLLVDYARQKKRRVKASVASDDADVGDALLAEFEQRAIDLEALAVALDELELRTPSMAKFVRMHFFGHRTVEQCAELLGIPKRSLERSWEYWRTWLYGRVS